MAKTTSLGVVTEWSETEARDFMYNPHGEVGRKLMHVLGAVVVERARTLAERRTGKMAAAMRYEVSADEIGVYADVISPVVSDAGFPYAIMHERIRKPRDRRPHRSLIPAAESLARRPL